MSLHRTRPNETRPPEFQELPDGRKRLTRYFELPNGTNLTDALVDAWGTADVGPATGTTAGFANLRLVDLRHEKINEVSYTIKVYEELPATAEQQVGSNTVIKLDDGRTAIEAQFLQFSSASATPGTVGTDTAPGDTSAFLQREEVTNDGALRRIKRTYVYAGTISTDDESLQGGALLKKTIVAAKTAPSTPSGYTLVGSPVQHPNGLPVYTYTYAKGTGQVSREDNTSNNGALLTATIRYLTVPGTLGTAGTNPITTPSGYTLTSESFTEADGHRIWTANYAKGTGRISREDTQRNNGALLLATIRYISVPGTLGTGGTSPITAPSGYTLVSEVYQEADGHRIWTANYAKGLGEISRDIDYSQSSDEGVTGLTRTTIRYLVAPAGTIQPTTLSGSVLIRQSVSEEDGHRVWTTVWAKGTGTIRESTSYRNNGKLLIVRRTALGAYPSAPTVPVAVASLAITAAGSGYASTPTVAISGGGGSGATATVTLASSVGQIAAIGVLSGGSGWVTGNTVSFTGDGTGCVGSIVASGGAATSVIITNPGTGYSWISGYSILTGSPTDSFTFSFTLATGSVIDAITLTAGGSGYTSTPTVTISGGSPSVAGTASATLDASAGSYTAISDSEDDQDGVILYSREWAFGSGVIDIRTNARGDGLRTETWVSLGETYDAAFMLPAGVLLAKDSSEEDGTKRWIVTCIQNASGTSPLVGTTVASVEIVSIGNSFFFTAPTVSFSGGGGGSGATATATIDGNGILTAITVTAAGTGYTSAPLVTLSAGLYDTPVCAAILSNGAITQEKLMPFTYPGRAKAIALEYPGVATAYNLDVQLSPPIDAMILGAEEVSYRADNSLSDLTYPLWSPTEWATVFAQFAEGSAYVSKCEGIRGYRAVVNSGGTTWVDRITTSGYTSVLGRSVTNVSGVYSYLRVFGGPDAPDGQTFTLDANCELAFIGYTGTRYYRRTVRYATIPPQNAMPDLTTAGVAIISSTVTNLTTLRAVVTAGVAVGGRTNSFRYTWTQGGVIFVRTVRATLVAGALANETTFYIKPTDYATTTNEKYWVLA